MDIDDKLVGYANEGNILGVMLMLDMGADVFAYDDYALRFASVKGHTEIVKLLKEHINKGERNAG